MWPHFLNLLSKSWVAFFQSLGSTPLGFFIQFLLPPLGGLAYAIRRNGWKAIRLHLRKTFTEAFLVMLCCGFMIYGGLFLRSLVVTVYADHMNLLGEVAQATKLYQMEEKQKEELASELALRTPSGQEKEIERLNGEIERLKADQWVPLTDEQILQLKSQLAGLTPEPIQLQCATHSCLELEKSLIHLFEDLHWPTTSIHYSTLIALGVTGIAIMPSDPEAHK
jgi:hypothetical protein